MIFIFVTWYFYRTYDSYLDNWTVELKFPIKVISLQITVDI